VALVLTMQQLILALTRFWAERGATVLQPANTEVAAGTLNAATFLRILGPEPWRAAYVEPSVRPDDSRYGDNPNRLATHTQFQVVLKPEPGNAQQLYLDSLRALGLDPDRHDVRFVENNWSAPALGASGLGWEVWLDGLEITQFTYFQQAGGHTLDPVPVEIAYGVERIAMAVQRVAHVRDLQYASGLSYGEVFGQAEVQHSAQFLEASDVGTYRSLFETYETEARRLLAAGLPVPAHAFVLKCAHAFSVLDARQAIGATERTRGFGRMRDLSHQVADAWLLGRKEAGHPLGCARSDPEDDALLAETVRLAEFPRTEGPEPLVLEIGFEELPAGQVDRVAEAVRESLTARLAATRLPHGEIRVVSSPRRVVALVADVGPCEPDHEQTVRGPRLGAAFDDTGAPSQAVLGFARSHEVDLRELQRVEAGGRHYVGFVRPHGGRRATEVLAGVLPEVVSGLRTEVSMRWSAPGLAFARPIRWILAVLGRHVVPFSVATLCSGRTTRLAHSRGGPPIEVDHAAGYLELLFKHGVTADAEARRSQILARSEELARTVEGTIDAPEESELLAEVSNLVERPMPLLARFDQAYLSLPQEVLTTVMRTQQRYLPIRGADGALLPYFITVADGDCDARLVAEGHEAVLRARYADAAFFYEQDLRSSPERMGKLLGELVFAEELGSVSDRVGRVAAIATELAGGVELSTDERHTLARAGELAKFDLASALVTELPGLAGVMAREYARQAGEPQPVADALYEIELPRHTDDVLPATVPGALLAVADRLDLIAGLFAVGSAPTAGSDPFGLRRAALGVTAILRGHPRLAGVTLTEALTAAAQAQPVELSAQVRAAAERFLVRRVEQHLLDAGHPVAVVRAVLPVACSPTEAERCAGELARLLGHPNFRALAATMQRVRHIVPAGVAPRYYPQIFTSLVERDLHEVLVRVSGELSGAAGGIGRFAFVADALVEPIESFFADVLVMCEDPVIRANRLGLLAAVADLGEGVLAWEELAVAPARDPRQDTADDPA
jgi:glycyl-tRNA synthetase